MSNSFYDLKNEVHWNPITGCDPDPISLGCDNCWARRIRSRNLDGNGDSFAPQFHPDRLDAPLHWSKPRIFPTCFMGDWMAVDHRWSAIVMEVMWRNSKHQFLTLTKRAENLLQKLYWQHRGQGNVWLGVSAENQECWNQRAPFLCALKELGWHTWVSLEPLLGPINIAPGPGEWITKPDWVVVGCESGPRRRPCNTDWIYNTIEQCRNLNVPCYVKQIDVGGRVVKDINDDLGWRTATALMVRQYPKEFGQ